MRQFLCPCGCDTLYFRIQIIASNNIFYFQVITFVVHVVNGTPKKIHSMYTKNSTVVKNLDLPAQWNPAIIKAKENRIYPGI